MKSISPKSHFDKNRCFLGSKRSTDPNVNLLGPQRENPPPKYTNAHAYSHNINPHLTHTYIQDKVPELSLEREKTEGTHNRVHIYTVVL